MAVGTAGAVPQLPPTLPAVSEGWAAAAAIPPPRRLLASGAGQEVGGGDGRPVLPIASQAPRRLRRADQWALAGGLGRAAASRSSADSLPAPSPQAALAAPPHRRLSSHFPSASSFLLTARVCSRFPPPLGAPFLVPIPSQILTERLLEAKHRALRPCPSSAPSTSLTSPSPSGVSLCPRTAPQRPAPPPPPRCSLRGRVLAGPLPARLSRLFNPALFPVPSYPSPDPSRDNPCPQHRIWVHLFLKWKLGIRAALGGGVLISSGTGVPPQC